MILTKLKRIFYPKIIQFSPIRSGSTLVFNLLKEIYPNSITWKCHNASLEMCKRYKMVVTYRNPLDCLTSSLIRYNLKPTEKNIQLQIEELKKFGLDDLMSIYDCPEILKLKYEFFFNDFDYVFNELERYFGQQIPKTQRTELKEKYHINQILSKINQYKDFSEYDRENQFHGNHISKFKGTPNAHQQFFTNQQLIKIRQILATPIQKLGYSKLLD